MLRVLWSDCLPRDLSLVVGRQPCGFDDHWPRCNRKYCEQRVQARDSIHLRHQRTIRRGSGIRRPKRRSGRRHSRGTFDKDRCTSTRCAELSIHRLSSILIQCRRVPSGCLRNGYIVRARAYRTDRACRCQSSHRASNLLRLPR